MSVSCKVLFITSPVVIGKLKHTLVSFLLSGLHVTSGHIVLIDLDWICSCITLLHTHFHNAYLERKKNIIKMAKITHFLSSGDWIWQIKLPLSNLTIPEPHHKRILLKPHHIKSQCFWYFICIMTSQLLCWWISTF